MRFRINNVNPILGVLILAICLLFFLLIVAPLQNIWGMYGLAITEIGLLLIGVFGALIFKDNFKDIFPMQKPKFHQVRGVLLLWVASYIINILIVLITQLVFPGFLQVANGISNLFNSVNFISAIFIAAVMPAICEEIVHRGVILHTFKNVKSKWLVILSMGIIFGVFHLDPYRFLPTAFLGALLTYIMIATKNILLPMIFHFINNMVSVSATFFTSNSSTPVLSNRIQLISIGTILIISSLVPMLIARGSKLIKPDYMSSKKVSLVNVAKKKKQRIIIIAVSVMLVVVGGFTIGLNFAATPVFSFNENMDVSLKSNEFEFPMSIAETREYFLELTINNERGISEFLIVNENNEEVYRTSAGQLTKSGIHNFDKGNYTIIVRSFIGDNEEKFKELGFTFNDEFKKNLNLTNDPNVISKVTIEFKIK